MSEKLIALSVEITRLKDEARQIIETNVKSDENPDGVLIASQDDYLQRLNSLETPNEKLATLLNEQKASHKIILDRARAKSSSRNARIRSISRSLKSSLTFSSALKTRN